MTTLEKITKNLQTVNKVWLLTGAAGFIGSHLLEALLRANQSVVGLDNFSTGKTCNLDEVRQNVGESLWKNFSLIRANIANLQTCKRACAGVDYVLHQAAVGSIPRSINSPILTHRSNVDGFINMLTAAKDARVKRFVYASSSSVYGDHPALPKIEQVIGNSLSPYAASKRINELYADVFARCYGIECIGLRYFNVFGPRQSPTGPYAAVIPKWVSAMIQNEPVYINGDGESSRDFCFVTNVVQANLLAATAERSESANQIYNIATAESTSLNGLFKLLNKYLAIHFPQRKKLPPIYRKFQPCDVRHSLADISKAQKLLGYKPTHSFENGLAESLAWYINL